MKSKLKNGPLTQITSSVSQYMDENKRKLNTIRYLWLRSGKSKHLVAHGKRIMHELDKKSREAVILQHKLLVEIMKENKNTEYGRKYGFADILNVRQFKDKVPFSTYDDYEPYIQRMMKGETNILSAKKPLLFAMTAGSIGVPKHIPVSEAELSKCAAYTTEMAFGVADEYYRCTTGKGTLKGPGLVAVEMKVTKTASGVRKGHISSTLMEALYDSIPFLLSSPWEILCPDEEMDMKYLKSLLALANPDLVFMESAFMTSLVDLMDYIKENYEMLCKDIYHGRINKDVKVPDRIRTSLEKKLTPNKARARYLLREFKMGFDKEPIIPRIWPRMSWIGSIGTGGYFPYTKKMRKYSGKNIPFNNMCYAASESFMAVARHMGDESYVLLPDGGFYEFIPARAEDVSKTYNIDELEIGEDYEIVITNLSGFYRYRLGDVVRVTGYYNQTPLLRFVYRKNQLVSIAGEKTNEEALRWAVDEFTIRSGLGVSEYSIFADLSTSPGHYTILMEPDHIVPESELPHYRSIIESTLMQANPSYGEKVRTGVLKPLELVFVQQQSYQLYREMMVMKGASPDQLKPVRVIDTPAKEKFFFGLREY